MVPVRLTLALALLAGAPLCLGADPGAAAPDATAWRGARWGMTPEEVLKAFPSEVKALPRPVPLPNGEVVLLGIDEVTVGGTRFEVRFVFGGGKLRLVSLRTPEKDHPEEQVYAALLRQLQAEMGSPGEENKDDRVVDTRVTRWVVGGTRIDLKYIPGLVVILRSPAPAKS